MSFDTVVVGSGFMGKEYIKSLIKLNSKTLVICNKIQSKTEIQTLFPQVEVESGGFETHTSKLGDKLIITSPIDLLDDHLELALKLGYSNILLEKPGSIDRDRMKKIIETAPGNPEILVGYNRRYYSTVRKAKEIIEADGGVLSFEFNITELVHRIDPSKYHPETLKKWVWSMTSHLIDLAFYLGGKPTEITTQTSGKDLVPWHPNASIFSGQGVTDQDAIFSYHGNWASAGRWRLEIYTRNYQILFYPLEKLKVQVRGKMQFEEYDCPIDQEIKEGIFLQTQDFIEGNAGEILPNYKEQYRMLGLYGNIAGYSC